MIPHSQTSVTRLFYHYLFLSLFYDHCLAGRLVTATLKRGPERGLIVLSIEEGYQNSLTFDLTNHPKGVYYLKVVSSAGVTTIKIVKL